MYVRTGQRATARLRPEGTASAGARQRRHGCSTRGPRRPFGTARCFATAPQAGRSASSPAQVYDLGFAIPRDAERSPIAWFALTRRANRDLALEITPSAIAAIADTDAACWWIGLEARRDQLRPEKGERGGSAPNPLADPRQQNSRDQRPARRPHPSLGGIVSGQASSAFERVRQALDALDPISFNPRLVRGWLLQPTPPLRIQQRARRPATGPAAVAVTAPDRAARWQPPGGDRGHRPGSGWIGLLLQAACPGQDPLPRTRCNVSAGAKAAELQALLWPGPAQGGLPVELGSHRCGFRPSNSNGASQRSWRCCRGRESAGGW